MMLAIDQRELALRSGLSLPTIQRMEASGGFVRGHVESMARVVGALERSGVELFAEGVASHGGGRGVSLKVRPARKEHLPPDLLGLTAGRST